MQVGSGQRNSSLLALGLAWYMGIRTAAERLRADITRLSGASKPGTLLLSHNPDIFPEAVQRRVSLVLSGHSHGGQIRVPGLPGLVRQSRFRFDEGCFRAGDSQLVVSRGLGATGLPLRIACPPEAVLLSLLSPGRDDVGDAAGSASLVG